MELGCVGFKGRLGFKVIPRLDVLASMWAL